MVDTLASGRDTASKAGDAGQGQDGADVVQCAGGDGNGYTATATEATL